MLALPDVRAVSQIGDLVEFQLLLQALAGRSGQPLNLSVLSRDLGISLSTVKRWLSVATELAKDAWHHGRHPRLNVWRTSTGVEVDVLLEHGGSL